MLAARMTMAAAGNQGNNDPYFANVKALLQPATGDTSMTDKSDSAHTVTQVDNATVSSGDVSGFDGPAGQLDGSGDYYTMSSSTDFDLGSSDWTFEFFVRFNTVGKFGFWDRRSGTVGEGIVLQCFDDAGTYKLRIVADAGGWAVVLTYTWSPVSNTTYHIAFVRDGSNWFIYVDGTKVASTTLSSSITDVSSTVRVGAQHDANFDLDGYLTMRFTAGIARYTAATETVPSRFPTTGP